MSMHKMYVTMQLIITDTPPKNMNVMNIKHHSTTYQAVILFTVEPLHKGHLSNVDTVRSPNHIESCTN